MLIRTRVAATCLLVAAPVAAVLLWAVERRRAADLETALVRVVTLQVNDQTRERCESDPNWFFVGPQVGRPPGGVFVPTLADQLEPRPRPEPQPFELFAYDEAFGGSSSAAPRFPNDLRVAMRQSSEPAVLPWVSDAGAGLQVAVPTGWSGGLCRYFLGRLAPSPHQQRDRFLMGFGILALTFAAAYTSTMPFTRRVRRLARDAHESVDNGFTSIAPDQLKDELSSLTFVLNDSAQTLHDRRARIEDLTEALRRFVQTTDDEVARPLALLEAHLGRAAATSSPSLDDVREALRQTHLLTGEVENLMAATRLKMLSAQPPRTPFDLSAVIRRVVDRHRPIARANDVSLRLTMSDVPMTISGDEALIERAISNLVDNAVRYNRPGGDVHVDVRIEPDARRFRLFVIDNGPGVSEEHFRGLTAIRRFRGDESRNRRPNAPGLGLAVVREVCDRFGLQFDLKRPASTGFEVEMSGNL